MFDSATCLLLFCAVCVYVHLQEGRVAPAERAPDSALLLMSNQSLPWSFQMSNFKHESKSSKSHWQGACFQILLNFSQVKWFVKEVVQNWIIQHTNINEKICCLYYHCYTYTYSICIRRRWHAHSTHHLCWPLMGHRDTHWSTVLPDLCWTGGRHWVSCALMVPEPGRLEVFVAWAMLRSPLNRPASSRNAADVPCGRRPALWLWVLDLMMEALQQEPFQPLNMFELKWPLHKVVVSLDERKENYKPTQQCSFLPSEEGQLQWVVCITHGST